MPSMKSLKTHKTMVNIVFSLYLNVYKRIKKDLEERLYNLIAVASGEKERDGTKTLFLIFFN